MLHQHDPVWWKQAQTYCCNNRKNSAAAAALQQVVNYDNPRALDALTCAVDADRRWTDYGIYAACSPGEQIGQLPWTVVEECYPPPRLSVEF